MAVALSIDLESWVFPTDIRFINLSPLERKKMDNGFIIRSINDLLDLLNKSNVKLTFYVLTQLYEWYPNLIREIKNEGHEIGYHSYSHLNLQEKIVLENDLELSKAFIKEFNPQGFRAPFLKFDMDNLPLLKKKKFLYSSTSYGSNLNLEISLNGKRFLEKQITTLNLGSISLPIGSGYFMSMLNKFYINILEAILKKKEKINIFTHNWQIMKPDATFPDLKFLFLNPLYFPYGISCRQTFIDIIKNFNIIKVNDL
jgi:peptidoglycan/xylan/chitin deacetylase (PgdA/CDA1 family)